MSVPGTGEGDGDRSESHRFLALLAVAVLLGTGAVLVAALAGPAAAGDAVALFELPGGNATATSGDTVEVDVWLRTDGGYADEGLESAEFVLAVPPAVGEPVDAEPGPFLAQDGAEVEQTVADAGPGALRVRQERVDATDGVTGWDCLATVTVEVAKDAPAADAVVVLTELDSGLAESPFPMRNFGDEAVLAVDGGGERLEPAYEPAGVGGDGVNVTTPADANRTVRTGGDGSGDGGGDGSGDGGGAQGSEAGETAPGCGAGDGGGSSEDPIPGFDVGAALVALVVGVAVGTAVARWR